jgi:hypothetical protein
MVGAANIVSRDDGDERSSAVGSGGLHATECVCLDGGCGAVTVAPSLNTCINACSIAAPKLDISICDGLAA